jgi:hypothetical protein
MPRISPLDRVQLLLAVLLASYQVVAGIEGLGSFTITAYTVGFGALLVAGLLVIILGFEILDTPHIAVVSTIIPLSLSTGLVGEFYPSLKTAYLIFILISFGAVVYTRYRFPGKTALVVLVTTHAISGLVIFVLPILVSLQGKAAYTFGLVGIGGALIGVFGLLLSLLKAKSVSPLEERLWKLFPLVLLLATTAFVIGFVFV